MTEGQETQTQTPPQAQLEVDLFTWGSCKRGYAAIIWPRYIDLSKITGKEGKHTVETDEVIIEYENHDSRKNMNRDVTIKAKKPIIVRVYGRGSCNPKSAFDEVYLVTPEKVEKIEPMEKQMTFEEYDGKETATYIVKYIKTPDGQDLILEKVQEVERKISYEKMTVKIQKEDEKVVVLGDTYHIRDRVKKYGFKWSEVKHAWVSNGNTDVVGLVRELRELGVKVEVEGIDIPEEEATAVEPTEEEQGQPQLQVPLEDVKPQELEIEIPETPQPAPQPQLAQPQPSMEVKLETTPTTPTPQPPTPTKQELVRIYLLAMRLPTKHLLMQSEYERDGNGVLREVRRWDGKTAQIASRVEGIRRDVYARLSRVFCHVEEYGVWVTVSEDGVKEAQAVSKFVIEELKKLGIDKIKNISIEGRYGVRVVPIYLAPEEARNLLSAAIENLSKDVEELERKIEEAKQNENKKYLRQLESERSYRVALLETFKKYLSQL
jgi:vacuolar-type H+-ATPase subunit E/Vma4